MDLNFRPEIAAKFNLPPIKNIYSTLPKNPNKQPWAIRKPEDIKMIVVHHAGDTGTIMNEAYYHIHYRNWYTIPYHISIDRGGIYQLNDLLALTCHALGVNNFAIGVCINWDLTLRPMTQFEHDALIGVILSLKDIFPNAEVSGHNEASWKYAKHSTTCPVISMDKVRSDLIMTEQEIIKQDTPQNQAEIAYRMANEFLWTYNMFAKGVDAQGKPVNEETKQWAIRRMMLLEKPMRDSGFIK